MHENILIIIPTYNEAHNIEELTKEIFNYLPQAHILVIDDNSPDGTHEKVRVLSISNNRIHIIKRKAKIGLRSAYQEGFRYALKENFDYIIQMDADFSHHPRHLPSLVNAAKNADLVLGSRYVRGGGVEGWNFLRKFISRGGSLYAKHILNVTYFDLTGGFKCFRHSTLSIIDLETLQSNGYAFQIETTWRAHQRKLRIVEIPIVFENRTQGKSKMSGAIFKEAIWRVWQFKFQSFLPKN
ncbi:MAG TPA: polyprenol monophosphomannose synthase [Bdellovibrionota bacterium]|nr:polyprenol monophosphomannose synthase [Bdellovibrionota bacterium]